MNTFRDLGRQLRGEVLVPGADGYDAARSVWNGRIDHRPAAIARCVGTADVLAAVRFARASGLPLSVRGGGHHVSGHAVGADTLMIDLSPMDGIRIDPVARLASVCPGARVRDLDHEAQAFGLMTTGAPVPTVGIAGYTLGGGLGWTSRLHGLACDNLIAADVVTADGELVHATDSDNPDLMWALRGGGGGFGVVTSFELRMHALGPRVLAGPIVYPLSDAADLLRSWRDIMLAAPDALQCMPVISALPPEPGSGRRQGDTVFVLFPLWAGDSAGAEEAVAPLRALGSPSADGVRMADYATLLADLDALYSAGHRIYYRSAFVDDFTDDAIDAFVSAIGDAVPSPWSSAFLEPMGGAIARKPADATAFPHRERRFCITAVPKWEHASEDAAQEAWADDIFAALEPYAAPGVYVNYLDRRVRDVEWRSRAAWGDNRDRLVEVRLRWDPEGVFPLEPPLSAGAP